MTKLKKRIFFFGWSSLSLQKLPKNLSKLIILSSYFLSSSSSSSSCSSSFYQQQRIPFLLSSSSSSSSSLNFDSPFYSYQIMNSNKIFENDNDNGSKNDNQNENENKIEQNKQELEEQVQQEIICLPSISDCPLELRDYCYSLLQQCLQSIDFDSSMKEAFLEPFMQQLLEVGILQTKSPREYRKWLSQSIISITKAFVMYQELAHQAIRQEIGVLEVLHLSTHKNELNQKIFQDITSHHRNIISQGWNSNSLSNTSLQKYANAAVEMGKKDWVMKANQLMETNILKFFCFGGAKKKFIKSNFKNNRFPTEVTNYFSTLKVDLFPDNEKISVLDVGSCYNYFYQCPNSNKFQVVALDLCPTHNTVYQGDFLKIQVGNSFRTQEEILNLSQLPKDLTIIELPENTYDAVTFSLVLSYLPSWKERQEMITKARLLLIKNKQQNPHHKGLLVIADVPSLFAQSKNEFKGKVLPNSWIQSICSQGFELVTHQNPNLSHKVHIFVFCISYDNNENINNFDNDNNRNDSNDSNSVSDRIENRDLFEEKRSEKII